MQIILQDNHDILTSSKNISNIYNTGSFSPKFLHRRHIIQNVNEVSKSIKNNNISRNMQEEENNLLSLNKDKVNKNKS